MLPFRFLQPRFEQLRSCAASCTLDPHTRLTERARLHLVDLSTVVA